MERKSLSDILKNQDALRSAWEKTEAATDFAPLPAGEYVARIIGGELCKSMTNETPGFKLTFKVLEGEHVGRQFWHDLWLTPAALPMAKRDLAKLGVVSPDQLEQPLPRGIVVRAKLALRKEDDGRSYNRVKSFDVLRIDPPEADPFAPSPSPTPDAPESPDLQACAVGVDRQHEPPVDLERSEF